MQRCVAARTIEVRGPMPDWRCTGAGLADGVYFFTRSVSRPAAAPFRRARGTRDIEGKVSRVGVSEPGRRASFKEDVRRFSVCQRVIKPPRGAKLPTMSW
jgi:hypothetical protein